MITCIFLSVLSSFLRFSFALPLPSFFIALVNSQLRAYVSLDDIDSLLHSAFGVRLFCSLTFFARFSCSRYVCASCLVSVQVLLFVVINFRLFPKQSKMESKKEKATQIASKKKSYFESIRHRKAHRVNNEVKP